MKLPLLTGLLVAVASTAFGDTAPSEHAKPLLERDAALGDFGGLRSAGEEHGVTFSLLSTQEYLGVVAGGLRRAGEYNGLVELDLDLDLEKSLGWKGGLIHASSFAGWGRSLSGLWIGDESNVSNINLRNGTRLFEAWLQQSFGERLSIRAGLLATDAEFYGSSAEFAHAKGGSIFVNSDFGAIPILSFNVPEPIFPIAGPGVSVTFTSTDALTFRAAIYDGQPIPADEFDDRNAHGFEPRLSTADGALILGEIQYDVNKPAASSDKDGKSVAAPSGLGGSYRVGAFYHSGKFTDWGSGRTVHGLAGGWISMDQMLWRENARDDQGLSVFGRLSAAPRDRSVLEFGADGGLLYHGLIPGRDDDDLGLGVSVKRYSRDYSRAEGSGRDHETIVEATYQAAITPWLTLQPDVQFVLNPAGDHSASSALVAGLRASVNF